MCCLPQNRAFSFINSVNDFAILVMLFKKRYSGRFYLTQLVPTPPHTHAHKSYQHSDSDNNRDTNTANKTKQQQQQQQ